MNFYLLLGTILVAGCHLARADSPSKDYSTNMYSVSTEEKIGDVKATVKNKMITFEANVKFNSDYPFIVLGVYPKSSIDYKCRVSGKPLKYGGRWKQESMILFSGLYNEFPNNKRFTKSFITFQKIVNVEILQDNLIVLYTQNAKEPSPSTIACGLIGNDLYSYWDAMTVGMQLQMREIFPWPTILEAPETQFERITDLYSATTKLHIGTLVWKDHDDIVELVAIPSNAQWNHLSYVGFLYRLKDVQPGCVTTGNRIPIPMDFTSPDYPDVLSFPLLKSEQSRKTIYAGQSTVLKAWPIFENINNISYAVVLYSYDESTVFNEMAAYASADSIVGCGIMERALKAFMENIGHDGAAATLNNYIRPDDGSEDPFLAWAPPGLGVERVSAGGRLLQTTLWANKLN